MPEETSDLQHVLDLALRLSHADKARLLEKLIRQLDAEFRTPLFSLDVDEQVRDHILEGLQREYGGIPKQPRPSLYGLWSGADISSEDIDAVRREMWGNLPREDIE